MPIIPLKVSDVMVYDDKGNLLTNSHITTKELKPPKYVINVYSNGVCTLTRLMDGE